MRHSKNRAGIAKREISIATTYIKKKENYAKQSNLTSKGQRKPKVKPKVTEGRK